MIDVKDLKKDIKEAEIAITNALDRLTSKYNKDFEFDVSIMKIDSITGLENIHITTIQAKLT